MSLWIADADPIELRPNASEEDLQVIVRAVYRQVLGNPHLLQSERFSSAESMLRNGDITVRGFIESIAKSDFYKSRYFESSSPYRFIELNFKHFLGRAPQDQAEISQHVCIYNEQGYDAEIDSYLNSEEYLDNFGENVVPYPRGNRSQAGIKNVGFNRTFAIMRGYASSSLGGNAKLISDVAGNRPTKIAFPYKGSSSGTTSKRFRITVSKAGFGPRVRQSNAVVEVGYSQLSQKIQNIQKTGGKILSITEVA